MNRQLWTNSRRMLSLNEIAVTLRPFFFEVHPDRFAQHPEIRRKNEKSLQTFNGYLNDLFPATTTIRPIQVQFSIVDKTQPEKFKEIRIELSGTDPVRIARMALESCQLSTSELPATESFKPSIKSSNPGNFRTSNIDEDFMRSYLKRKKQKSVILKNLRQFADERRDEAMSKMRENEKLKATIKQEIDELKVRTGIRDVVWQMDWAETHIRRCLKNVHRFIDQSGSRSKQEISQAMFKNVLRFGRGSFTCCDGSIQLGADHVLEQWEQVCVDHINRKQQIPELRRTTQRLSETLGGAQIRLPYYKNLAQTLTQIQQLILRIWNKEALLIRIENAGKGTIVDVVTSYDELSVGLDGCIHIPCNVDIPSLTVFLEQNGSMSSILGEEHSNLMESVERSRRECINRLKLRELSWDPSVSLADVIKCLDRLSTVDAPISGCAIFISTNPTMYVRNDGAFCIPIEWV
ncbi:unnamed protein product [Caenorhabditis bovis]|uniref:DUF4461 domain-containing protein n=1 Tax=Caenorhabditis bovis TaxID=2654633 RepID=A0A8S1FDZ2_9PELO|nr:unnamed protein product [Caenorhabditis bovis]